VENDTLFWHGDQVWPERIALLRNYPHLRRLILWGGSLTSDRLAGLRDLTQLTALAIGECPVDSGVFDHLRTLSNLTLLNLSFTAVGARFAILAGIAVEELRLQGCRAVADSTLGELAAWRALRRLDVRGTSVSETGIAALRTVLPGCAIEW
jgi:hypothetical protein